MVSFDPQWAVSSTTWLVRLWHNSGWLAALAQERPKAGWWSNFHYRVQTRSAACREQQQQVLVPKAFVPLNVCFCILLMCFNQRNVFQLLTAMCTEVIKTVGKITSHVQVKKQLCLSTASKIICHRCFCYTLDRMIDFREVVWTVSLRKAVHRAVTKNNCCVLRVMPRFERPTCRAAQSPRACQQKWGCLELEWSIWQHCPSWIFPMKIRITVKQAWKSNMKLEFVGMFIGPT